MVIFNLLAFIPAFAAIVGFFIGMAVYPDTDYAFIFGLVFGILTDFGRRYYYNCGLGAKRLFLPSLGGHIFFLPIWLIGFILLITGLPSTIF